MAGGIGNFSPMIGNNASQLMNNLKQLIAANPAYLTSGIPTHLIQQMWKKEPEQSAMQPKVIKIMNNNNVRFDFLLFRIAIYAKFERIEDYFELCWRFRQTKWKKKKETMKKWELLRLMLTTGQRNVRKFTPNFKFYKRNEKNFSFWNFKNQIFISIFLGFLSKLVNFRNFLNILIFSVFFFNFLWIFLNILKCFNLVWNFPKFSFGFFFWIFLIILNIF